MDRTVLPGAEIRRLDLGVDRGDGFQPVFQYELPFLSFADLTREQGLELDASGSGALNKQEKIIGLILRMREEIIRFRGLFEAELGGVIDAKDLGNVGLLATQVIREPGLYSAPGFRKHPDFPGQVPLVITIFEDSLTHPRST